MCGRKDLRAASQTARIQSAALSPETLRATQEARTRRLYCLAITFRLGMGSLPSRIMAGSQSLPAGGGATKRFRSIQEFRVAVGTARLIPTWLFFLSITSQPGTIGCSKSQPQEPSYRRRNQTGHLPVLLQPIPARLAVRQSL